MPAANETMISFLSAFADYERKMAKERTKAALKAKKERELAKNPDFKLGNTEALEKHRNTDPSRANEKRSALAKDYKTSVKDVIKDLTKGRENASLSEMARVLNENGYTTRRGKQFTATAVKRVLEA